MRLWSVLCLFSSPVMICLVLCKLIPFLYILYIINDVEGDNSVIWLVEKLRQLLILIGWEQGLVRLKWYLVIYCDSPWLFATHISSINFVNILEGYIVECIKDHDASHFPLFHFPSFQAMKAKNPEQCKFAVFVYWGITVNFYLFIVATTLLESHKDHQRVRILSRKAQESIVLDAEPYKRRRPFISQSSFTGNDGDQLTRRQIRQRGCWQREQEDALQEVSLLSFLSLKKPKWS
jgi:hypothetical protein